MPSLVTEPWDNLISIMHSSMAFSRKTSIRPNLLGLFTPLILTGYTKLHHALYGLKQAPKAWFECLHLLLHQLGFHFLEAYSSLSSLSLKMVTLSLSLSLWIMFSSQEVLLLKCSILFVSYKPHLPWKILATHLIALDLGYLQYAIITHSKIIFSVNSVSQFM